MHLGFLAIRKTKFKRQLVFLITFSVGKNNLSGNCFNEQVRFINKIFTEN